MGVLSWLRGRRAAVPGRRGFFPAGTAYDEGLIERLKTDHQDLVDTFSQVSAAAAAKRYDDIPRLLARFKAVLQAHIMTENVKFYVYLHSKLAQDPTTAEYVAHLRGEMDGIACVVVKFANTHAHDVLTEETAGEFASQMGEVREVLLRRIRLAESKLYALYAA